MGLNPTTNENKKQPKSFYRKWWFWVIVVIVIGAIASSNDTDVSNNNANTTNQVETNIDNEKTSNDTTTSTNEVIEDIKEAIKGSVDSENETITEVVLKDNILSIVVDLSKANPSPLTIEDLAISRTSSITDDILELKDYDDKWKEIVVDFGDIGKITNSKEEIKENEYGLRYFATENFVLEK